MTDSSWQSMVQREFAIDLYQRIWGGCEVHENDSYGQFEETAKLLDFGDVDKIIFLPTGQIHLAQRFRRPYGKNNQDGDFTLRYSRPSSTHPVEHQRLWEGHESDANSYPRLYSFGRVYEDPTDGIYELYIIDTDKFISAVKVGRIPEYQKKAHEGQIFKYYKIPHIMQVGAVVAMWREDTDEITYHGDNLPWKDTPEKQATLDAY